MHISGPEDCTLKTIKVKQIDGSEDV